MRNRSQISLHGYPQDRMSLCSACAKLKQVKVGSFLVYASYDDLQDTGGGDLGDA